MNEDVSLLLKIVFCQLVMLVNSGGVILQVSGGKKIRGGAPK